MHEEGRLQIPTGFAGDLDERTVIDMGSVIGAGPDIFFSGASETERFVEPVTPARLSDAGTEKPSSEQCANAPLAAGPVPIGVSTAPFFLCVRTDEQRLSVVRIEGLSGPNSETLEISFTTFQNN